MHVQQPSVTQNWSTCETGKMMLERDEEITMCECCEDELATSECPECGMMLCDLCMEEHNCDTEDW